jgi:peptidoglycan/xylan/chitin deacetylase (PgdA/CDA1 family)
MPAERTVGMDHDLYTWSPLPGRPALRWPDQARLAVGFLVQLTSADEPVSPGLRRAALMGGLGKRPEPDVPVLAHRAYGHRVGIFRVLEALERYDVPATVLLDVATARDFPFLVDHVLERGATIVACGRSAVDLITEETPEDVERAYVSGTLDELQQLTGVRPQGWFSPEYSESSRTPQILADAGLAYTLDWVNDEQPYRMSVGGGDFVALPPTYELDDANVLLQRTVLPRSYGRMLVDAFDVLHRESADTGRVYLPHVRPWLTGQPFRVGHLEQALAHIARHGDVWRASTDDMVRAFLQQQ